MYNPTVGVFATEDPEGFVAGDDNLYRFVGNDPKNATDPTGLYKVIAVRIRSSGKLADLDAMAANGKPYSTIVADIIKLRTKQAEQQNTPLNIVQPTQLGPMFLYNKAFMFDGTTPIAARSIISMKFLYFYEWDIKIDNAADLAMLEKTSMDLSETSSIKYGDAEPIVAAVLDHPAYNKPGSLCSIIELKNPTAAGANYRIIYGDDPGVSLLPVGKDILDAKKIKPIPILFSLNKPTYVQILNANGVVEQSTLNYTFSLNWDLKNANFDANGVTKVVDPLK